MSFFGKILHSIVRSFVLKRLSRVDNFMAYPIETQNRVLQNLLYQAKDTDYGKLYHFGSITNDSDFRKRLPIVSYEDIEPLIEKSRRGTPNVLWRGKVEYFAKSSGTTNAQSKYIPITKDSLQDCHYRAGKDMIAMYLRNHKDSQLFRNKNLRLGGSAKMHQSFGTKYGDLSAILMDNLPFWVEYSATPSKEISLIPEWEKKLPAIVSVVKAQSVGSLTGVPSWMLLLLQAVKKEINSHDIREIWPELEVFFHGGITFTPYEQQYRKILGEGVRYYETYNASEGFFGIQDQKDSKELLLLLDYGVYFEFIPMDRLNDREAIPLELVEIGKNYAVVITTNGGLWRYMIGDTIRFTNLSPYRFKISGRTKHFINAFGEEVVIDNAEAALAEACKATSAQISDYTAGPIYMKDNEAGAHEWVIEFSVEPNNIALFTKVLDQSLQNLNSDYEAKRYQDFTLKMPVVHLAKKGLFYEWMSRRGKLGGQNKVPRLSNDRQFLEPLLELNR